MPLGSQCLTSACPALEKARSSPGLGQCPDNLCHWFSPCPCLSLVSLVWCCAQAHTVCPVPQVAGRATWLLWREMHKQMGPVHVTGRERTGEREKGLVFVGSGYIVWALGRTRSVFKLTNQLPKRSWPCAGLALQPICFLDLPGFYVPYPV